jgi:hypothetical protein
VIEQHRVHSGAQRLTIEVSHSLPVEAPAAVIRMANKTVVLVRFGLSWAAALVAMAMLLTGYEQSVVTHLSRVVVAHDVIGDSSIPANYLPARSALLSSVRTGVERDVEA